MRRLRNQYKTYARSTNVDPSSRKHLVHTNCVIKLHQHERQLRLQRNQGELTKDIIFVRNKQRARMEDNFFFIENRSASPADATMRRNHEHR